MIRQRGGQAIRGTLAGDEVLQSGDLANANDHGLFGPASVTWRVHGDSSMLIGGVRSLMIQTLHPSTMAGVDQHSTYNEDPLGRLNRTGRFIGSTTFGSTATAEQAIDMVNAIHQKVQGTTPDGITYSAADPHQLLWVHVTEVDSFLRAYERYGSGRLRDAEKNRYVNEMAQVGEALGAKSVPRTVVGLAETLDAFRPECAATPAARHAMKFLLNPPLPIAFRAIYPILAGGAVGLLPSWARKELRLTVPPLADPLAIRPAATVLTKAMGWLMSANNTAARSEDNIL